MTRNPTRAWLLAALFFGAGAAAFAQPPELGPSHRAYHAMAYDAESGRVVMFGGMTGLTPGDDGAFLNRETWSYDPTTGVWRELSPAETPTTSSGAAVAYDAESDRVILFGGTNAHPVSNHLIHPSETWAFDLDADRWTMTYRMGKGPQGRDGARMAYDAESDRVILFGGRSLRTGNFAYGTWVYDFNANSWTRMAPPLSPEPRAYAAMTYDAESDRVILFGGAGREGVLRDTWAYDVDYDRWTPLGRAPGGPSARYHAAMAYSAELDRVVLHGGYDPATETYFPEVWAYDYNRNRWALLRGVHPYGDLARHAMVYRPGTGSFIVFGGQVEGDSWEPFYTDETWILGPYDTEAIGTAPP